MEPRVTYTSYIRGSWMPVTEISHRACPGDLDATACRYSLVGAGPAKDAMEAASEAFGTWSAVPPSRRLSFLHRLLDAVEAKTASLAETITRENGKVLQESEAEVKAALTDGRYLLEQAKRDFNEARRGGGTGIDYCPVGVFLLITPWNFPLATLIRKIVPALAYGNTVVAKPSEITPGASRLVFALLDEMKLPAGGTANLVLGRGGEVGPVFLEHPALRGVSLTGSTDTGRRIQTQAAGRDIRLQLEMGGKNALLVLGDADLDAAVEAARIGAFSCAGQWCTGTSRVIVEAPVYEAFCTKLAAGVRALRTGPGHRPQFSMGPVAYEAHFRAILEAIERAERDGAELLVGGSPIEAVDGCRGWFIEPTVFTGVTEEHALFHNEIFGPVLAVSRASDVDDAIRMVNASDYGLAFSVFTADHDKGEAVISRVNAGICHLNLHTAYRTPDLPVSGWKESGRGIPECGTFARSFFTRPKAVYTTG